ncbi:hypothetical protein [Streptomyces sp. I5]|uniref:hypothetical protein n=1 Tax=Streptomyces sp. I5 TaxID=2759947 RepID=UPI001E39773D|nr:hypothetical protein [Streptomyces sp. I5]
MTDHSVRPGARATASGDARDLRELLREPSNPNLDTAVHVAREMLAAYGTTDYADPAATAQALGATRESLRILLRALGVETTTPPPVPAPSAERCPAAHPDDPTPCGGPVVVTVLDRHTAGVTGCEHHGARLLASVDGARVVPLPTAPEGVATRVFKTADSTPPYAWEKRGERR